MKRIARIWLVALLLGLPVAAGEPSPEPEQGAYETPGVVEAGRFLPESFFQRKKYRVGSRALNDGLRNTYYITGAGEVSQVTGSDAVLERLRELDALDALKKVSDTEAYGVAPKEPADAPASDALDATRRPRSGAARWFIGTGETSPGAEDTASDSLVAAAKKKREFAAELGVDVYSPSKDLQKELDRVARAAAGGSFGIELKPSTETRVAGDTVTDLRLSDGLQESLKSALPEELEAATRKALIELGANETLVAELLEHPWFTPRHLAILSDALKQVGKPPELFVQSALQALSAEDAFYFQRAAQLLAVYAKTTAPLSGFKTDQQTICALDAKGTLVVPVCLDYAIWTEAFSDRVDQLAHRISKDGEIKAVEIWTDGQLSDRVKEELAKRGIGYHCLSKPGKP